MVQEPSTAAVPVVLRGMLTGTPDWKLCAEVVVKVTMPLLATQPLGAMETLLTPSVAAPVEVLKAALAGLSSPWKPMVTTLWFQVVEPFKMPCGVTRLEVCAMTVALEPMVHGEQFAWVTLYVKIVGNGRLATGNVQLNVASLESAMTTLEPGTKLAALESVTVATLLATAMEAMGKGAPGASTVGATPAVGMATPWPMTKSLTPPEQVI